MTSRTNNPVESFYASWNESVSRPHPSLWLFIRKLKDRQKSTEVSLRLRAATQGELAPLRKRKWRRLEQRIINLKQDYQNGDRDIQSYWNAVAHVLKKYR